MTIWLQSAGSGDSRTDTVPSEHASEGRLRWIVRWIFLYGDRRVITLATLITILSLILFVGTIWEFEMERLITETRAVQALFNTLLGGIILFVSVVLSINTAALTQEFSPLQTKLTHIEDSIQFQVELETLVDDGVTPAGLQPFLEYVIGAVRSETKTLRESDVPPGSERAMEDLLAFVDDIDAELSRIESRVRETDSRTSVVLLSSLDYPYARHINTGRRLKAAHGAELPDPEFEALDTLLQELAVLASGREYFTTLYFKRELRHLSSSLLVISLPVIVFTAYILLAIDARLFPEVTLPGVGARLLYVNIAFVVALSPYVLLSSYMLRILTVSKHSLERTVFTLETEGETGFADRRD